MSRPEQDPPPDGENSGSVVVGCLAVIGALALLPVLFVVVAVLTRSAAAGTAAMVAIPLVVAIVAAARQLSRSRSERELSASATGAEEIALVEEAAAPVEPGAAWRSARERFTAVQGEYAGFECDPLQVLRLPALTDVAVPSTARFVDAFAAAQALCTDDFPGRRIGELFVEAAETAERAWRAAVDAAERIRLQGIAPAERAAVERVVKLLTTARDSDSEPERLLAYARARTELARLDAAGVVHVPTAARTALDAAARGQLPG